MAVQGLKLLPVGLSQTDALKIFSLLPDVVGKLGRLDEKIKHSPVADSIIQTLSLQESVESTRIEGTQVTFGDMVEEKDDANPRWEIIEVMNYHVALHTGLDLIARGHPISTRMIQDLHQILMTGARGSVQSSGQFRKIQNFIGPNKKIEDATYIPISAEKIDEYMSNLENFINGHPYNQKLSTEHISKGDNSFIFDENSNALIKAAIMHAQFESIHPFLDGNGRLGRILIVLYLIHSKLITQPIMFVSEELEKEKIRYYDLLNGVRGEHPDWGSWIHFFLIASDRMASRLIEKLDNADKLADDGLNLCNTVSEERVWLYTFANPMTTAKQASDALSLSVNTVRTALNKLVEKNLLFAPNKSGKRNIKYRNYDLIRILA